MTTLSVTVNLDGVPLACTPQQALRLRWHVGIPRESNPEDVNVVSPRTCLCTSRKVTTAMDLQADKKVALSVEFTDEAGNTVPTPTGATAVYSVDDTNIIALTDNGDGTASAAATGVEGVANVHVDVTFTDDAGAVHTVTGDLQLVVVAGDAERVAIVAGDPEEVTPDV